MIKILIIFFLMCGICFAGEVKFDKDKSEYTDSKNKKYSVIEVPLVSDYSYQQPDIDKTKALTKDEQDVVEFSLKENGRKLVHKELKHKKNDYKHDFDRGTVEYTPRCRNYSFHKVTISDGTTIIEANFSQKKSDTEAGSEEQAASS